MHSSALLAFVIAAVATPALSAPAPLVLGSDDAQLERREPKFVYPGGVGGPGSNGRHTLPLVYVREVDGGFVARDGNFEELVAREPFPPGPLLPGPRNQRPPIGNPFRGPFGHGPAVGPFIGHGPVMNTFRPVARDDLEELVAREPHVHKPTVGGEREFTLNDELRAREDVEELVAREPKIPISFGKGPVVFPHKRPTPSYGFMGPRDIDDELLSREDTEELAARDPKFSLKGAISGAFKVGKALLLRDDVEELVARDPKFSFKHPLKNFLPAIDRRDMEDEILARGDDLELLSREDLEELVTRDPKFSFKHPLKNFLPAIDRRDMGDELWAREEELLSRDDLEELAARDPKFSLKGVVSGAFKVGKALLLRDDAEELVARDPKKNTYKYSLPVVGRRGVEDDILARDDIHAYERSFDELD